MADNEKPAAPTSEPLFKAQVFGPDAEEHRGSQQLPQTAQEARQMFMAAAALEHPLGDPVEIAALFDLSTALRGCIDSYCTNIDGFGHRLEPIIDLEGDEADEKIADALWMRRANEADDDSVPMPTPEEVAAEKDKLRLAMRRERLRIEAFIQYACLDYNFITLRKQTRLESELLGNAFWEIERDKNGYPVELHHLQSISMRLLPLDSDFVSVEEKVKISDIDYGTVRRRRHFRRFMQVIGPNKVFFKEFGDPRTLSRLHGTFFEDVVALKRNDELDEPASEVVHFVVYSPSGPVGMPRWAGGKLQMIGLRESQEVNRDYFENKAVPPLAIAVSGGHFGDESVTALKDHFENKIKGKKNFHKVLLLEAESAQNAADGGPSRTRIQFFPLTDAQLKDAIFGQYDVRCTDTIGFMFRLPRLLRGDIEDVNRSTAEACLVFAEMQVFQGPRGEFDDWMNRKMFPAMGYRYWNFVSNGPIPRDSVAMAELIVKMANAGVITAEEAREFAADVFNKRLAKLVGEWLKQPFPLTLKTAASIPVPGAAPDTVVPPSAPPPEAVPGVPAAKSVTPLLVDDVQRIVALRDALLERERAEAAAAFAATQDAVDTPEQ
jgi:PBSX family phage portal protein